MKIFFEENFFIHLQEETETGGTVPECSEVQWQVAFLLVVTVYSISRDQINAQKVTRG